MRSWSTRHTGHAARAHSCSTVAEAAASSAKGDKEEEEEEAAAEDDASVKEAERFDDRVDGGASTGDRNSCMRARTCARDTRVIRD